MRDGRMFTDSANEAETAITLAVLNAVQENDRVTQRSLAQEVGVALGLANAYLKRCVKKGLIKVKQAPANRYLYYLTPKGFAEKSRLTTEFLSYSLHVFRQAREEYAEAMSTCEKNGWHRIALYGVSDLTEVAMLSAIGRAVEVLGVVESSHSPRRIRGLPVVADLALLEGVDAVLLTNPNDTQQIFDSLAQGFPPERILAPSLLRVVRNGSDTPNHATAIPAPRTGP